MLGRWAELAVVSIAFCAPVFFSHVHYRRVSMPRVGEGVNFESPFADGSRLERLVCAQMQLVVSQSVRAGWCSWIGTMSKNGGG